MLDIHGYCFYFKSLVKGTDGFETIFHQEGIQELQKILRNGNKVALIIDGNDQYDISDFEQQLATKKENVVYLESAEKSLAGILNSLIEKWPHGTKLHFYADENSICDEANEIKEKLKLSLEVIEKKFSEPTRILFQTGLANSHQKK